jgi:hypothetical protein
VEGKLNAQPGNAQPLLGAVHYTTALPQWLFVEMREDYVGYIVGEAMVVRQVVEGANTSERPLASPQCRQDSNL